MERENRFNRFLLKFHIKRTQHRMRFLWFPPISSILYLAVPQKHFIINIYSNYVCLNAFTLRTLNLQMCVKSRQSSSTDKIIKRKWNGNERATMTIAMSQISISLCTCEIIIIATDWEIPWTFIMPEMLKPIEANYFSMSRDIARALECF